MDYMKFKRITALLAAMVITVSIAGCNKNNLPGQSGAETQPEAKIEVQDASESDPKQIAGMVTEFNGTKITIDIGEIKMTPANTSENGNDDDSAGQSRRRFGFDSTGKSATYDISGLKRITIENGREKSEDTIDKIRTGSFVVIKLGDDGKPVSLTLRSFGGRNRGNGGNGKGNGERGNRPEGSRNRNKDRNGRNRRNNDAADA